MRNLFYGILCIFLVAYSFSLGKWQLFPYEYASRTAKNFIRYASVLISTEVDRSPSDDLGSFDFPRRQFGEYVRTDFSDFSDAVDLNNFVINFKRQPAPELWKVGAAYFENDYVWYVNQEDPDLIQNLGMSDFMFSNAGVKAYFSLNGHDFVYVTYVDQDCASGKIVSLDGEYGAYQLPCFDADIADLNGAGGAIFELNDSEVLLSIGTPTTESVNESINLDAAKLDAVWGKIFIVQILNNEIHLDLFSSGHRNPQGITQIADFLLSVEHGPRGGDELNILERGFNYGWPNVSFGSEYDLSPISKGNFEVENTKLPLYTFVPSIGISSLSECPQIYAEYYSPYSCVLISSMRGGALFFLVFDQDRVYFQERVDFGVRIRKVFVRGNDIALVTDFEGLILGSINSL